MKKNQKKIVGTLLGLMASISGTSAVMKSGSAKDNNIENNAGNTKNQNDESKVLKKRVQAGVNPYLKVAGFVFEAMLLNDLASTVPGAGKYFRPLIRPLVSNYRVVHGFRGYINRHDNPLYKNIFKLAGDDGHDFRVVACKGDNWFKWRDGDLDIQGFNSELYTRKIARIEDNIDAIPARNKKEEKKEEKKKMKLSEYLSEPSVNLVAEAKVKDRDVYYRLFDEYASIWSIDDAAKAVGKANKLLDIINNEKMSKEEKKNAILKKFGENAVFVPSDLKEESTIFRICLKKSKMNVDDLAEKIAKEKFLAGELGDIKLGLENEVNKQAINGEKGKIRDSLSRLEQLNGVIDVDCYVEFKIV